MTTTDLNVDLVPKTVWQFDFLSMSHDQLKNELNHLESLLKDIDENPNKYKWNFIELDAHDRTMEPKTVVCLLPKNAFRGYVIDALDVLQSRYIRGFF